MTYYAEQKCLGRSLHKMVKDDDPNQVTIKVELRLVYAEDGILNSAKFI